MKHVCLVVPEGDASSVESHEQLNLSECSVILTASCAQAAGV